MDAYPQGGGFQNQSGFGMQQGSANAGGRSLAGCQVSMAVGFVLIGLAMLAFGILSFASYQQLHASHATATGTLSNCTTTTTDNHGVTNTSISCTVTYTVNRSHYSSVMVTDTATGNVTVYYDPSYPSNAETAQQYYGINSGIWLIAIGAVFILIGGIAAASVLLLRTRTGQ